MTLLLLRSWRRAAAIFGLVSSACVSAGTVSTPAPTAEQVLATYIAQKNSVCLRAIDACEDAFYVNADISALSGMNCRFYANRRAICDFDITADHAEREHCVAKFMLEDHESDPRWRPEYARRNGRRDYYDPGVECEDRPAVEI